MDTFEPLCDGSAVCRGAESNTFALKGSQGWPAFPYTDCWLEPTQFWMWDRKQRSFKEGGSSCWCGESFITGGKGLARHGPSTTVTANGSVWNHLAIS